MICGCSRAPIQAPRSQAPAQLTVLDRVLAQPDYSNAIVQAQRDLPGDKWRDKPWHYNVSRDQREYAVSKAMLGEIRPRLRSMSVTELVGSFKMTPYPEGALTNAYEGVAMYLFADGNEAIINEIKSRPTNELQVLRALATDKLEVYRGPQGFMTLLDQVIKYDILHE